MENEEQRVSSFNQAAFQMQRLHYLWTEANHLSIAGELNGWRWRLEAIWRELCVDATEEDNRNLNGIRARITKAISSAPNRNPRELTPQEETALAGSRAALYTALTDFDVFLRRLEDRAGKGSMYKRPDEDDFD